ncbi:hypothetical protein HDV00_001093 [Rhizophlyctis rosea]|nr:hypothetical protein HDV00_001093 [Rhizophlyctis rosea]
MGIMPSKSVDSYGYGYGSSPPGPTMPPVPGMGAGGAHGLGPDTFIPLGRKNTVGAGNRGKELGNRSRPSLFKSKSGPASGMGAGAMPILAERSSGELDREGFADVTGGSDVVEAAMKEVRHDLAKLSVDPMANAGQLAEDLIKDGMGAATRKASSGSSHSARSNASGRIGGGSSLKASSPAMGPRTSPLLGSPGSPGLGRKGTINKNAFGHQYPVRCLKGYTPRLPDELALQAGDMVEIM